MDFVLRANADAEACVFLRRELCLDALEAVVPAGAAARAHTKAAERQGDLVHHDEEIRSEIPRLTALIRDQGRATQVHVRLWLYKSNGHATDATKRRE